jgi:metal-dependent amidase/aminoacylase/carboxypeptidase family protein
VGSPVDSVHSWRTTAERSRIEEVAGRMDREAGLLMRQWREAIDSYIDSQVERWCSVRRYLHAHPEPSREEYATTQYLANQLGEAGLRVRIAPSGRGLVAEPEDQVDRKRVAIRADIDALRIADAKSVPYRSSREGLMHACGHDAHATMALVAARALWESRDVLPEETARRSLPAGRGGERGCTRNGRRRRG